MGYGAYGAGPGDDTFNRFSAAFETAEYRMANLLDPELIVCRSKLAELNILDTAVPTSGANLDTDHAAVWYHNKNEVRDRDTLFRMRRRELCTFLGIPPGPGLKISDNTVRFIV
nr:hypothetical protein [uncultured Lichenicoccus sp.]